MILWLLLAELTAQTVPGGVGVSASRSVAIPADEALIEISLTTTREVTLDGAVSYLSPLGVGKDHFSSMSVAPSSGRVTVEPGPGTTPVAVPSLVNVYGFSLSVDPAGVTKVIEAYQQINQQQPGFLGLSLRGALNVSDGAIEANRPASLAQVFADANRRAGQWRQAAGIQAAPNVALAESIAPGVLFAGGILGVTSAGFQFSSASSSPPTYSLNLQAGAGPRSVSTYASRVVLLAPEEVVVSAQVEANPSVPLERIVEWLAPAGFTAGDSQNIGSRGQAFTVVLPPGIPQPQLPTPVPASVSYVFTSIRAAGEMDSSVNALEQLRRSLMPGITGLLFGAALRVKPATVDLLRENLLPQLLDDTRRRAADLARLAGWRLGVLASTGDLQLGFLTLSVTNPLVQASSFRVSTIISAQYTAE